MSDYHSPPSAPSSTTNEHLPTLTTYTATHASDRTSALRLVADSVAQQRQLSSYALITHPYPLSATIFLLGILSQYLEFYTFITTTVGIVTSLLILVRALTSEYTTLAEAINYNWLNETPSSRFSMISNSHNKSRGHGHKRSSSASSISSSGSGSGNVDPAPVISTKSSNANNTAGGNGTGKRSRNNSNSSNKSRELDTGVENIVVVAKWGEEEIIGALVMRVMRKEKRCVVRAWTVKGRYRGNGVGRGLLEEGVRVAMGKGCVVAGGWQDKEKETGAGGMEFDEGHVNAKKILPEMFNRGFERRERRARAVLAEVVAEQVVVGR